MSSSRRLMKELSEIKAKNSKAYRLDVDENNLLVWNILLLPDTAPFDKGAFRAEMNFPVEYPFKPPKITFKTKIYHPGVGDTGQICLAIITSEHWKPATKVDQVLEALSAMLSTPNTDHPLRTDLAEELIKDRNKFMKAAEEYSRKYGEKRPTD